MTRAQFASEEEVDESIDEAETTRAEVPERKSLFRMPNVREDLKALPSILTSRRMVLLPLALLVIGFILVLVFPGLSADLQVFAGYYLQFFYVPPALFTFFLAGFFAPRASYLVGALYGLIAGVLWAVEFSGFIGPATTPTGEPSTSDPVATAGVALVYGVIYGTLAAALASWYRDFLRGMQERGKQRRAVSEVDERAKRREQRQEARKLAKQRPTT
jgi:signal transduction histidine kinase